MKSSHRPEATSNLLLDTMASREAKQSLDTISFKDDIYQCLDICSSYIQALNTLCSTGAVLAQNLTQVFSRDLVGIGKQPANELTGRMKSSRHCLNFLKSNSSVAFSQMNGTNVQPAPISELDATYYDVAEQFLRVWEMMSVSTAGASATIKTETLMSLQEVINKLESPDAFETGKNKAYLNMDSEPSLEQCIQSAKSCLLSYIELQSQFSYNSWKALSQLSKVLKSDNNMADVVKNIKQHFSFNDQTPHEAETIQTASTPRPREKSPSLRSQASSSSFTKPLIKTPENELDSFGIEDALNLLSLESDIARKPKKRSKRRKRVANLGQAKSATSDPRLKSFDISLEKDTAENNKQQYGGDLSAIKQSTWPGKATNSERGAHYNDWSLWSNPSEADKMFNLPTRTPFSTKTFQDSWNAFALSDQSKDSTISCSVSASASGSLSESSNTSMGMASGFDRRRLSHEKANNNVREPSNVDMFGSLNNFLESDRSAIIAAAKRLSSSSDGITVDSDLNMPCFAFNDQSNNSGTNTVPLDVRVAKTSTWPLKQASSTSSTSNWTAFSPIPLAGEDDHHDGLHAFDISVSSAQQQQQSGTPSDWPFMGPKMHQFSLFEANNNNNSVNKNY